jgi:hypothetical protein
MGKGPPDQGAKSGPAQAPPAASARHFHDGPLQAQERRSSELRIIRQTWCWVNGGRLWAQEAIERREVASFVELTAD